MTQSSQICNSALITGASSGIGRALAIELARKGYAEIVLVARNESALNALAIDLQSQFGTKCIVIAHDLQRTASAQSLFEEVVRRKISIDTLVNNAGFGEFGEFKDTALETELSMVELNISTVVALTKLFLPSLIQKKGRILNLASVASFLPGPHMAVYYATKAFVLSFTESLAEELNSLGVNVTALCPGPTQSGFVARAAMEKSAIVRNKKLPTADEVAREGIKALMNGQRVVVTGILNQLTVFSVRFMPRRLTSYMVKILSRKVR